jgi:hypothetical protein
MMVLLGKVHIIAWLWGCHECLTRGETAVASICRAGTGVDSSDEVANLAPG